MAELRKITRSSPLSNFSQVGPEGGSAFLAFADVAKQAYEFMKPAAMEQMANEGAEAGSELARRQIGQNSFPVVPRPAGGAGGAGDLSSFSPEGGSKLLDLIDRTEGGGDYSTLFGHSQRQGGAFAGVDVSKMTIGQVKEFARTTGKYGQWVAQQVGRVATPMGRFQIVGSTLNRAAKALGLSDDTPFDAATQHQIAGHLAMNRLRSASTPEGKRRALRQEWEGFKHASDAELDEAIAEFERGGIQTAQAAGVSPDQERMSLAEDSALQELEPSEPPTLVRTSEGKLEPRMFSPLSGEILQAHRAAASTAYLSDMLVKGGTDMMSLSETYIGNPDGFQQAVGSYIDEVVKSAPGMMRGDLRQKLTQDAQRRYMGMVEEQQRETRQRANNSSRALMDRYQNDYAEALASGNYEAAAAARGQLEEVLIARESLPGVAWTREQSENAILGAQDAAVRQREANLQKVAKEQAGTLRTIIKAAEDGRTAADESILDDPNVSLANPELAAEAAAKVALRDMMPGFFALPPAEMDAMIAEEQSRPVGDGWELDLGSAMEDARNKAVKALRDDPIAYAQERLPQKPPALDDFSSDDPDQFVSSLAARREYANEMVERGYVDQPAYLSKAEIESLSGVMSKNTPPEVRAALAGAIVSGFGPDAGKVFKTLKIDGVTAWGGQLMARGGSGAIAAEALRGQQMIDEKLAQLPPEKEWREVLSSDFRAAFGGLPTDAVQAEADALKFAKAIYANRAASPGFDGDKNAMKDAIQTALGQTTAPNGRTIGGVQELFKQQVLMPVGMNAEDVQRAVSAGFVPKQTAGWRGFFGFDASDNMDFWANFSIQEMPDGSFKSGGVPRLGGEYLPAKEMLNGNIRFIPVGGTRYRMVFDSGSSVQPIHTEDGLNYIVDFSRL